jgi:hypothetical protein
VSLTSQEIFPPHDITSHCIRKNSTKLKGEIWIREVYFALVKTHSLPHECGIPPSLSADLACDAPLMIYFHQSKTTEKRGNPVNNSCFQSQEREEGCNS